jgi:hypothetical protein
MSSDGPSSRVGALNVPGGISCRFTSDVPSSCVQRREACPHVSVGRLLIATASARRHSGSKPEYPCYRTMTYSKGAPGEVMLDGTVSDPVACPSMLLYRLDEPPFGARSARRAARALATSRTALRLSRVVVNESFGCALYLDDQRRRSARVAIRGGARRSRRSHQKPEPDGCNGVPE